MTDNNLLRTVSVLTPRSHRRLTAPERRVTWLRYDDSERALTIEAAKGSYGGALDYRDVSVNVIAPDGSRTITRGRIPVDRSERIDLRE